MEKGGPCCNHLIEEKEPELEKTLRIPQITKKGIVGPKGEMQMGGLRMFTSCFRPKRGSRASDSGLNRAEPQPAKSTSKEGLPPLGPGLQRVKSNPDRLPSDTPERPHVEAARPPITRTEPDARPPRHYFGPSKFLGIPVPFQTLRESWIKAAELKKTLISFQDIEPTVRHDPELIKIIKERSPNYDRLPAQQRCSAMNAAVGEHPKFLAFELQIQNAKSRIPTGPTATRTMTPNEQKFLTNAFQKISEDVRKNPFHIHGETAITGKKNGKITNFHHNPAADVKLDTKLGDKFNLHTHPPFSEPATSAASAQDHIMAAQLYSFNRAHTYVTNGKDVLHIQPNSTELVKLIPDPKMEDKLGKFPVAFTVPDPQHPPYPFSNHEAPGAL